MNQNGLSDKEMITDVLTSQKFITGGYNTNATESSGMAVKNTFLDLLDEEQKIGHEIFVEMQNRGWYQTEAAPQDKINQAKQKFSENCKNCYC